MRIVLAVVVVLVLVAGGAWMHLTAREMPPEISTYEIDLRELRRLAASLPGEPPVAVRSEVVATATMPRAAIFAGEGFGEHEMVHQVFQVVYPDGDFLVLDAGFDAAMHAEMDRGGAHRAEGFAVVQAALEGARTIFVTHEHADHIRGLAAHPRPDVLAERVRFTAEQLANSPRLDAVDMPEELRATEPLDYEKYAAVAPGAVLVKAAGHTPGSQLLYVRLADGRELLFVGDVAWHLDAIRELHYRPRLVTDWFLNEDREAVLHQLRRLHDLDRERPELAIVVSHDAEQRARLIEEGLLADGFGGDGPQR